MCSFCLFGKKALRCVPSVTYLQNAGVIAGGGCVGIGQDITASDSPCYDFVTGPSTADNVRIAGTGKNIRNFASIVVHFKPISYADGPPA